MKKGERGEGRRGRDGGKERERGNVKGVGRKGGRRGRGANEEGEAREGGKGTDIKKRTFLDSWNEKSQCTSYMI